MMTRKQKLYEARAVIAQSMRSLTSLNNLDLSRDDYQKIVGEILPANKILNDVIVKIETEITKTGDK